MNEHVVLLTGANGQLGYELQTTRPANTRIVATDYDTLDISDAAQLESALQRHQPDIVINAAAYTAVDKAEADSARAYLINAEAAGLIAAAVARHATNKPMQLVHVSTDFVFDGHASLPYATDAATAPLGVYGASKQQ
ncbi:MAG: sugar nucleotide-binding protein, partial [Thiolinea sp.]